MKKNIFFESFLYETVSEEPGCRDFGTFFPKKRLGESFESTISTDGSTPYHTFTFTGKEKDSETGYYAFGARYYDCDLSGIFLSVDPMSDKYPNISPYAYCAWNSVKLVDPDGNWPWEPKHIREARKCAHLNNGSINIERLKSGVKIANVGYFSVSSEYGKVFTIKSFTPKGYNSRGSIKKTTGLVDFELWMGESSENVGDFAIKQACIMGYSILNEPFEAIIGRSLAGSDINTDERLVAMISTLSSGFGKILSKGTGIIKTQGIDGLQKYNDFVKKSGGRNGRNQTEMGLLYQRNKQSLIDYSQGEKSYNIITSVLSVIKESKKND